MKTLHLFLTFVLVLLTVSVFAQSESALLKDFEIQTAKWKEAYNSKDAQNLVPLYASNARYVSSHVAGLVAEGRDQLIANFQKGMSGGGHIDEINILSLEVSSDLATLFCKYEATNNGEKAVGRNLLVLRKIDSNWLIVLHMTVV